MDIKKTVELSILLSLTVILSIIESFIPILNGIIPGLKIGLSNIIVLYVLYNYSIKDAMLLVILKVLLVSILRSGFSYTFYFSMAGSILSVIMMFLSKKTNMSIIGVSVVGSVSHLFGQLIIAVILLNTFNLIYYLPFLIVFGIISGIIVGIISKQVINNLKLIRV